jgi:hypothetical protein
MMDEKFDKTEWLGDLETIKLTNFQIMRAYLREYYARTLESSPNDGYKESLETFLRAKSKYFIPANSVGSFKSLLKAINIMLDH